YFDRTDFATCSAQAGRVRLLRRIGQAEQLGRDHGADWTGIDRSVRMTADLLIDRAGIKASATANASQRLPRYRPSEHARASVIEQNDVHLIRSFIFRTAFGSGNQGLITRQMLTRT